MKTIYRDIEITYRERENDWLFELRGRERVAPSLAAAKEAIDKPYKAKEDGPAFERFDAWVKVDGTLEVCTVTSQAHCNYGNKNQFWVSLPKKDRRDRSRFQSSGFELFRRNEHNDALAQKRIELDAEIHRLHEEREKVMGKMSHL